MNKLLMLGLAGLGLFALVAFRSVDGKNPPIGEAPPEIETQGWFNQLGPSPTLGSLRGQAVLIEFWATW